MQDFDAIQTLEMDDSASDLDNAKALQQLINSGSVWRMQGSYGRGAMDALASGFVMLGKHPTTDYYGNRVPSRDEVKAGTKGSRQLVVDQHGEDWALALDLV